MKLCVVLTEATTAAMAARMAELAPEADLFEVRADYVRDLDLEALLRARTRPILFTCRVESEGGRFPDADARSRRALLLDAARLGFDLVDVEARAGFSEVLEARGGRGIVLSWHDLEGTPDDLDAVYERMAAAGPEIVKIAVTARSMRDLGRLATFAARHAKAGGPKLLALAMGPYGVASRVLGGRFGAPFTFASAGAGRESAPGQLTARALQSVYRVRSIGPLTRVYGLLGSDVLRSLSPAIQNRAFAEAGIDAVYVPLQAESLAAFLEALPALGLSGFSVTRPYKGEILDRLDSVTPHAAEAGSANTVVVQDGRLVGMSTDGDGVLLPLRRRLEPVGRKVVILGAGGAARAAAFALVRAAARVTVAARRVEQAREVAAATGAAACGIDEVAGLPYDVLINATPLGSGAFPGQTPLPAAALRPGSVVFDMVYEPRETPLLAAARAKGCATIDGVEMLVAQAVGQFEAWTGEPAPVGAMREAAEAAIGEAALAETAGEGVVNGSHRLAQVPPGVQCFVGQEARTRRRIEETVVSVFEGWDYEEIIPPLFDYADVFAGEALAPMTYSFVARDGSVLALRPDFTSLLAKIAAGRLREREAPLRLYYSGEVVRHEPVRAGRQSELHQMGLEHLGGEPRAADAEVVAIAAECLERLGASGFVLALGHVGVFSGLVEAAGLDPRRVEPLRERVEAKDPSGVRRLLQATPSAAAVKGALERLATASGGVETLDAVAAAVASCEKARTALEELRTVVDALAEAGLGARLAVDLAEVRGLDYYTGLVFRAFAPGLGFEVGGGGRYDTLVARFGRPLPAVGFMLGLDRVALLLQRQGRLASATAPPAEGVSAKALGAGIASAVARRAKGVRVRFGDGGGR